MKIKEGNDCLLRILVKDSAGVTITNLATAAEILFQMKRLPSDAPLIEKKETLGEILVDDPTTGWLKIAILAADTQDNKGMYLSGCEVQWVGNNQEMDLYEDPDGDGNYRLFNTITIEEDIVT